MKTMRRVLVATDNSDSACRAVDAAAELAKATGALLIIVNVEQGYLRSHHRPPGRSR